MADLCTCGHEEREHRYDGIGPGDDYCNGNGGAAGECCDCPGYRRSPLSAFRGSAVTFTREEAFAALRSIWRGLDIAPAAPSNYERTAVESMVAGAAERCRRASAKRIADESRRFVRAAASARRERDEPRTVRALYLAARILRAVRA